MTIQVIIFRAELRKFLRSPTLILCMVVFLIVGGYSIFAGRMLMHRQDSAIERLRTGYQKDFEKVLAKFHPDTSAKAKRDSADAHLPVMINYWLPQLAIHPTPNLGFLSTGQRDIYPFYNQVKTSVEYLDSSNAEINNPLKLFTGSFDLSFVLVYLLPLLLIGLCYNLLAEEKELGTYGLLLMHGVSHQSLVVGKLGFRLFLAIICVLILNSVGLSFADSFIGQRAFLWMLVSVLYLLFWTTLLYCILLLGGDLSVRAAFTMLGAWLVLCIVLPAVSNAYLTTARPIPLRADIAAYSREVSWETWETDQRKLVATFLKHNLGYRKYYRSENDTESWGSWPLAGYYDLMERKINTYAKPFEKAIADRNALSDKLALLSPVLRTQLLFNEITGSSRQDHLWFEMQSVRFQKQWRDYIYGFKLTGKSMQPDDLMAFPVFNYRSRMPRLTSIAIQLLTLLIPTVSFIAIGLLMDVKKKRNWSLLPVAETAKRQ